MSQTETTSQRRRPPTWLLVGAGVVALGGVGAAVLPALTQDQAAPAPSAPATASTTSAPGEYQAPGAPVGGYKIEAGATTGEVAVDGRTPVGYPEDCTGAVTAATNYYVAINEALYQDRLTAEEFSALLDELTAGLNPGVTTSPTIRLEEQFDAIRADPETRSTPWEDMYFHPEWGAFRVVNCADAGAATVEIQGFIEWDAAPGFAARDAQTVVVSWFNDDWRLNAIDDLEDAPGMTLPAEIPAPVPATTRAALLASGGPAWTEYTNAPE